MQWPCDGDVEPPLIGQETETSLNVLDGVGPHTVEQDYWLLATLKCIDGVDLDVAAFLAEQADLALVRSDDSDHVRICFLRQQLDEADCRCRLRGVELRLAIVRVLSGRHQVNEQEPTALHHFLEVAELRRHFPLLHGRIILDPALVELATGERREAWVHAVLGLEHRVADTGL